MLDSRHGWQYTYGKSEVNTKVGSSPQKKCDEIIALRRKYELLKTQIQELDFVMQGSVVKRTKRCSNPACHCQKGGEHEHGPYYQWTAKVKGKTITKMLSPKEASVWKQSIANGRQLKKLLKQMYKLSAKATTLRGELEANA
jgi:hypothetical protein